MLVYQRVVWYVIPLQSDWRWPVRYWDALLQKKNWRCHAMVEIHRETTKKSWMGCNLKRKFEAVSNLDKISRGLFLVVPGCWWKSQLSDIPWNARWKSATRKKRSCWPHRGGRRSSHSKRWWLGNPAPVDRWFMSPIIHRVSTILNCWCRISLAIHITTT